MRKQRTLAIAAPAFLHYLVRVRADKKSVAHCLDYDLVAVAEDQTEAIRRLNLVVRAHVGTARDRGLIAPMHHRAPKSFWDELATAKTNTEIINLEIGGANQPETMGVLAAMVA